MSSPLSKSRISAPMPISINTDTSPFLPALEHISFSLTDGTNIPPPEPSPPLDPSSSSPPSPSPPSFERERSQTPEPNGGPLSSHPTTPVPSGAFPLSRTTSPNPVERLNSVARSNSTYLHEHLSRSPPHNLRKQPSRGSTLDLRQQYSTSPPTYMTNPQPPPPPPTKRTSAVRRLLSLGRSNSNSGHNNHNNKNEYVPSYVASKQSVDSYRRPSTSMSGFNNGLESRPSIALTNKDSNA
ncbi:hypothetical protein LTS18_008819, partial [Coniosporium uncinatum]